MKLSSIEENYIKSIYSLQMESDKVNTNKLAVYLDTSPASITDMLKKLQAKKLLEYKKYYGFSLNNAGKKEALKIIRRHRLWEYFLVEKLGMEWQKIHDIAEELEHVSSEELIEKLDIFLGRPDVDPHGDPIPDHRGVMPVIKQIPLNELPLKKTAKVSSISNQTTEMMEMLNHYGIGIGVSITALRHFEFDGSMSIKIAKQTAFTISSQAAQNIFVYDN